MLDAKHFDMVFPLGFSMDQFGRFLHIGKSLKSVLPELRCQSVVADGLRIIDPEGLDFSMSALKRIEGALITLESKCLPEGIRLAGQFIIGQDQVQFLVKPLEKVEVQPRPKRLQSIVRENLRLLVDAVPCALLLEDEHGNILHTNQSFSDFFTDLKKAELSARKAHELVAILKSIFAEPETFARDITYLKLAGVSARGQILNLRDGRIFERDYIPIRLNEGLGGHFWIYRDITDLKKAEKEALVASQAKSSFLANMSHEIRTPLNAIVGLTKLTLESSLSPEQRENLEVIMLSSDTLLAIVNDVLDFSKIEAGKIDLESVDFSLNAVLSDCQKLFSHSAENKGLKLIFNPIVNPNDNLRGDVARFQQILFNLVNNSIKFTPSGKVSISAQITGLAEERYLVRIEVADTGVGIPKAALDRLFIAFSQGDESVSRRFGGTGLGLSICKRLTDLMGGQIGVKSDSDRGSVFWFEIPFLRGTRSLQVDGLPMKDARIRRLPVRLLLAEDNIVNQKVAIRGLAKFGCAVDVVSDGREVLNALRNVPYDLILMDCQMPEMDGYETTNIIRTSKTLVNVAKIPIIALTANVFADNREKCIRVGMNDFVIKPIDFDILAAKIEQWTAIENSMKTIKNESTSLEVDVPRGDLQQLNMEVLKGLRAMEAPGEPGFVEELIVSFLQIVPRSLEKMARNIKTQQYHAVSREAHCLKSAAKNLGAEILGELCQKIENEFLLEMTERRATELLLEIEIQADATCKAMHSVLQNHIKAA